MSFGWQARALMISAALAVQPSICDAQSNIGSAASVRNQVEGILGGQTQALSSGSAVHSNELIRSGDGAVANLVFIDETKLSVGPRSEVRLDKFVYDPSKNTGAVVVRATRGAYRFVTGVQDSRNYEIKTPYATLGVRGTILELNLEGVGQAQARTRAQARTEDGEPPQGDGEPVPVYKAPRRDDPCRNWVKVRLVEGAFHARTISGQRTTVTEPNTVVTVCSDGSVQTSQSSQSILDFNPDFAALPSPGLLAIIPIILLPVVIPEPPEPVTPN
jgi:FecR protein